MPDEYVTIATYASPTEAELAKLKLEAAEIPAFILDSATGGVYGSISAFGVRVQVHGDHAGKALEMLRTESEPIEDTEEAAMKAAYTVGEPITEAGLRLTECPGCGSENIEISKDLISAFLTLASFVAALFILSTEDYPGLSGKKRWRCLRCGHKWKAP